MKFKKILRTIASLVILVFFIMLAWGLFTSMVKVFGDYTSTVEPTIVVAIISGLVAIIVNAVSKHSERKNQVFMKSKEKMSEVYESFLKDFEDASAEGVETVFKKYESIFAVNASDDTYTEFLALRAGKEKNTIRLIVSIRNELKVSGKKNKK